MNNDLYGVLVYKDKKYHFVLDDRFVRIIGEPFQYINDFNDADEIDVIQGVTAGNRDIRFLRCNFPKTTLDLLHHFPFKDMLFQTVIWTAPVTLHITAVHLNRMQ